MQKIKKKLAYMDFAQTFCIRFCEQIRIRYSECKRKELENEDYQNF